MPPRHVRTTCHPAQPVSARACRIFWNNLAHKPNTLAHQLLQFRAESSCGLPPSTLLMPALNFYPPTSHTLFLFPFPFPFLLSPYTSLYPPLPYPSSSPYHSSSSSYHSIPYNPTSYFT
ncbi:hypothetical protein NX059_010782 [Plenodomus lindquistii]|nr:hypothetical protein NX059_010782 [Plenodomus lindquistii]